MSTATFLLAFLYLIQYIQSATVLIDNITSDHVWDLPIPIFAEQHGPFSMHIGGTITIDITSTQLLPDIPRESEKCIHISNLFYLEIYVLSKEEFEAITQEDYDQINCYDETHGAFQIQNCWYYSKATQKYFIPLNDTIHTTHSITYPSQYR
eukprot:241598_1